MNLFIVYKGEYTSSLRAPELRYMRLAARLAARGISTRVAGRCFEQGVVPQGVKPVPLKNIRQLFSCFFWADIVLLHGGGPALLFFTVLASLSGKKVIYDAYVPRWIEIEEVASKQGNSLFSRLNAAYNRWRTFIALHVFDAVIVANQRQKDLLRGAASPFSGLALFDRIEVIEFGCDDVQVSEKSVAREELSNLIGIRFNQGDFLVGWFGGMYEWFDLDFVIDSAKNVVLEVPNAKFVFFGVPAQTAKRFDKVLDRDFRKKIIFWGWVPFERRFDYWAAFDVALVWGGEGVENDYASRTRNFDCLTLGIPIVQNHDDEWGRRISDNGIGWVCDRETIVETLIRISGQPALVKERSRATATVKGLLSWDRFTEHFLSLAGRKRKCFTGKIVGLTLLLLLMPAVLLSISLAPFMSPKK